MTKQLGRQQANSLIRYFSTQSQNLQQENIGRQVADKIKEASTPMATPKYNPRFSDREQTLFEYLGWANHAKNAPDQLQVFPNVIDVQPAPIPNQQPETHITTLHNGFKVATEQFYGSAASLQLSLNCGSAYEIMANRGITQLMQYMGFKTTFHRTHFRLQLELEGSGAIYSTRGDKEMMTYKVDFPVTHLPQVSEVMLDAILNPKLSFWEVRDFAAKMVKENKDVAHQAPEHQMLDLIYQTAYEGGLGTPTIVTDSDHLTFQTAREYYNLFYAPGNMVLSCVGAFDKQEVLDYVQPLVTDIAARPTPQQFASQYIGGEHRERTKSLETNICLLFEAQGGWQDLKQASVMAVIGKLLGGGGDFSAGGPGKGMQSRLYLNLLTQKGHYKNVNCITQLHNETGFIGLHGVVLGNARDAGKEMCQELKSITQPFPEQELQRSKNQLIRSMFNDVESASALADEVASNILIYKRRIPIAEYQNLVNSVTVNDINQFMQKAMKSRPTLVTLGNIENPPRESDIMSVLS